MRPKKCKDECIAFHQDVKLTKGAVRFRLAFRRVNKLAKAAEVRNLRRLWIIKSTLSPPGKVKLKNNR
ncbi:MAG: hypothetical protein ACTS45_00610 [Candidatus Hodgkinia cicadicola]